jgi:hypothetical protein
MASIAGLAAGLGQSIPDELVTDLVVAFVAGVTLGLVLGYWLLPMLVDWTWRQERHAARLRRLKRGR